MPRNYNIYRWDEVKKRLKQLGFRIEVINYPTGHVLNIRTDDDDLVGTLPSVPGGFERTTADAIIKQCVRETERNA